MLSRAYQTVFERTLAEVALATTDLDVLLVPFWPISGAEYDGRLLSSSLGPRKTPGGA